MEGVDILPQPSRDFGQNGKLYQCCACYHGWYMEFGRNSLYIMLINIKDRAIFKCQCGGWEWGLYAPAHPLYNTTFNSKRISHMKFSNVILVSCYVSLPHGIKS